MSVNQETPEIVLIEDHALLNQSLTLLFSQEGYRVKNFSSLNEARQYLEGKNKGNILIVSDVCLPDGKGYELLDDTKKYPIIFMTAYGQVDDAVQAISRGAKDFILKPFANEEIIARLRKVLSTLSRDGMEEELIPSISQKFIGESRVIRDLYPLILAAIRSDSTVLLSGETGTGKNLLARLIHDLGKRHAKLFQMVTCSSLPRNLIESELFGYEAGSFTGADRRKIGKLEYADGGTVFLDEIGELDRSIQVMLLRFLQDKSFERIGSNTPIYSNVRVITATNVNLLQALESGRIREDLYYRLNVVHIHIPPLRKHPEDIELLFEHFNSINSRRFNVPPKIFPKEMIDYSCKLEWPGNVREIENLVERLYAFYPEQQISLPDFFRVVKKYHLEIPAPPFQSKVSSAIQPGNLRDILDNTEEEYIRDALVRSGGNKSQAARLLGISRTALIHKIQKYRLDQAE